VPLRFWHQRRRHPDLVAEVRGEGTAVVLLHGQPGSASDWRAVADDLSADHRVIVPDRLGYGLTGGRATGSAGICKRRREALRSLGTEKAVVVGHSWAGGVALELAIDFPRQVSGLGLVSSVSPAERVARLDSLLARRVVGTALVAAALGTTGRLLSWAPARAFAGRRLRGHSHDQLTEMAVSWRRRSTWSSFAVEQRALVHELPLLAPRLASIKAPTAVVLGTMDRVIGPTSGSRLAGAIPGAELEMVAGGGHLLPQLQPAAVAAAIRQLAKRSEIAPPWLT
jgi:pimeloyl-ACP methyl ester carboxylesterase